MQLKHVIIICFFPFLDGQSTSTGSSDGDNYVHPGIIAAILLVFIIVVIVMIAIIIIVMKKKKSIRRSQQTATVASPQAPVVLHTNALVSSQAPPTNQSYPNPTYAQQQTPQALTGNEAALTPVGPQPVVYYPHYHGAGHAAAVGFASN